MSQACRSAMPSSARANSRSSARSRSAPGRARASRERSRQEGDHLLRRFGHLGHQRHLGEAGLGERAPPLLAQREAAAAHHRAVVERGLARARWRASRRRCRAARAPGRGARVLHHREIARGKCSVSLPASARPSASRRHGRPGPRRPGTRMSSSARTGVMREAVGGVEHVFGEAARQVSADCCAPGSATASKRLGQVASCRRVGAESTKSRTALDRAEAVAPPAACLAVAAGAARMACQYLA